MLRVNIYVFFCFHLSCLSKFAMELESSTWGSNTVSIKERVHVDSKVKMKKRSS